MSGPASLTRILAGATPSDLADWLEKATADAIANDRVNVIQFPCKREAPMRKQSTTGEAEPSLGDLVIQNIRAKAEDEQPVEPEETGDAETPPASAA